MFGCSLLTAPPEGVVKAGPNKELNGIKCMHTIQFSRIDHRSQSSIGSRSPSGAETTDDLAMDHGRAQELVR